MITIVAGDTHGKDCWKHIIDREHCDRFLFIGDYFDSFTLSAEAQMNNFLDITAAKETGYPEIIMLTGNHDFHYMPGVTEVYTGYSENSAVAIRYLIQQNLHHLSMCHQEDNIFFTHAGITKQWLKNHNIPLDQYLCQSINDQWKYKPLSFKFQGYDPNGDNITQSPIWVRPYSLMKEHISGIRQVVGHTAKKHVEVKDSPKQNNKYYFIDCLESSMEYLRIEDGEITIKRL